jgi:hypothetical protein
VTERAAITPSLGRRFPVAESGVGSSIARDNPYASGDGRLACEVKRARITPATGLGRGCETSRYGAGNDAGRDLPRPGTPALVGRGEAPAGGGDVDAGRDLPSGLT